MNRGDAYKLLSQRLNELRSSGYDALVSLVDQPARIDRVLFNGEELALETIVAWHNLKHRQLRVSATAYGPSTWMTERLDESFVVGPNDQA